MAFATFFNAIGVLLPVHKAPIWYALRSLATSMGPLYSLRTIARDCASSLSMSGIRWDNSSLFAALCCAV